MTVLCVSAMPSNMFRAYLIAAAKLQFKHFTVLYARFFQKGRGFIAARAHRLYTESPLS